MKLEHAPGWSVFKQIFHDHWESFQRDHPRYHRDYYDELVDKMLGCRDPKQIGYTEYRCLDCGQGTHVVPMSCNPLCVCAVPKSTSMTSSASSATAFILMSYMRLKKAAPMTYRERYHQSTGRDPLICPHCPGEMAVWRMWHPKYGVIYDEAKGIQRGDYDRRRERAPTDLVQRFVSP